MAQGFGTKKQPSLLSEGVGSGETFGVYVAEEHEAEYGSVEIFDGCETAMGRRIRRWRRRRRVPFRWRWRVLRWNKEDEIEDVRFF